MSSSGPSAAAGGHDHEWVLRAVDFEDTRSVTSYECVGCPQVQFR